MSAGAWLLVALVRAADPAPKLVEASSRVPGLVVDLRYATPDNFLHRAVYPTGAPCLLQPAVVERLAKVARDLAPRHLRLKVYDCYRPLSVQREMWALFPHEGYVANPAKGGMHNRAAAVDLTLVTEKGAELVMPTAFDDFSPRAHHGDTSCPREAQQNRETLRAAMVRAGFRINPAEWWHFAAPEALYYPLLDLPLTSTDGGAGVR